MNRSIEPVCSIDCGSPIRQGPLDFRPRQSVYCRGYARRYGLRRYVDRSIEPVCSIDCGSPIRQGLLDFRPLQYVYCCVGARRFLLRRHFSGST